MFTAQGFREGDIHFTHAHERGVVVVVKWVGKLSAAVKEVCLESGQENERQANIHSYIYSTGTGRWI